MKERKGKGSRPLEMIRRKRGGEGDSGTGGQCEELRGAGAEGVGKSSQGQSYQVALPGRWRE